ncbi:hypothetical protein [Tsukamurella sp. 1534]|uniref:hypothetical protein n=1 Tax=Tsukamurella sp. 1534 TaxID=1151061 RepID=UPI0002ED6ACE|nr:hypothetical protein [Tsukamurella sp. 1534]
MGDELLEYWFGDGAGPVSTWRSPAVHGAVVLDFDGDGRVDDAMIDLDSDGRADVSALDLDDDGTAEARFRDAGDGLWALADAKPAERGGAPSSCPVPGTGAASPGKAEPTPPEPPGPRVTAIPAEPGRPPRQAVVDGDGDGTPDVLLFDTDGDGTADGAVHSGKERPE